MRKVEIIFNEIFFFFVFIVCSYFGFLDEGWYYFELMKRDGIVFKVWYYVIIVDFFGCFGDFDRVLRFIREMLIEFIVVIWKVLFNVCRMYKNVELGVYVVEYVFEFDFDDFGLYVILYNIYVLGGRWNDVVRVRKKMKESGVKKEFVCSWVEIENVIYMFVANDECYLQREEISCKWEEIYVKIKDLGYVLDISYVVVYVD